MPYPRLPATSAPPFVPNLAPIQGPLLALPHPSMLQDLSLIQSHTFPHRLLPSLVASQAVPPLMSASQQWSSTPPAPPASCLSPTRHSRPSPMLIAAHPPRSTTAMTRVPVRLGSTPSLDKKSVPPAASTAPSASSGRIIPAHSHKDYNRRVV